MAAPYKSYKEIDAKYKSLSRPCIDGVKRGCNLCTGYCAYDEHPGFLTDKLIKQHRCIEKKCSLLRKKDTVKRERITIKDMPKSHDFIEEIMSEFEGLKVMESHRITSKYYTVKYITVASYDMEKIKKDILERYDIEVDFELLPYSFENAARLIFK